MKKRPLKIAIAYDFDGTIVPGNMQEHSFIPQLGIDKAAFWKEADERAKKNDMDQILAYMQLMLQKAREKEIPITKKAFYNHGKGITYFQGVSSYFDRINSFAKGHGVVLDHHIISSGLRDIIRGTSISKYFKNIFASGYKYDVNEVAEWPALAINYTNKTQYLFRINKGIDNSYDNSVINKYVEMDQ
ncbi:MAG: haloacid dehalogenase-like hydrolase, partial [Bacteroidetes bacterium]